LKFSLFFKMQKQKQYNVADSNIANLGSDLEKKKSEKLLQQLNKLGLVLEKNVVFKSGELKNSRLFTGQLNNMDLSMMEILTLSSTLTKKKEEMHSFSMFTFG